MIKKKFKEFGMKQDKERAKENNEGGGGRDRDGGRI